MPSTSPPPGDLPDPETEPMSPTAPALQAGPLPLAPPGKPIGYTVMNKKYIFFWSECSKIIKSEKGQYFLTFIGAL